MWCDGEGDSDCLVWWGGGLCGVVGRVVVWDP